MRISVAIDGPAGAGKSTIAKLVAKEFDLMYINTGAMYRAVALKSNENGLTPDKVNDICALIEGMDMEFVNDDLVLNGVNIQNEITLPEISGIVSDYASIPEVRAKLVELQREMSKKFNVIMDGRDIGTVVLIEAPFKFFLTATPEERANRRFKELKERNIDCQYEVILKDIIERDYKDSHREVDPLRKADDAIEVDTTGLNIMEVTEKINSVISNNIK
ncbi:(d)CMP kinase [Clostridium sp.]|uniref:(d)CMP kinase n=1 Tax=Clostridium sp. TaxID=1506 RepID=UPI001D27EFA4|nr:(d)CMP kinase [Clostridium sp.]MBS5985930.1 (d)CMP kinase [Clostridium sp.]